MPSKYVWVGIKKRAGSIHGKYAVVPAISCGAWHYADIKTTRPAWCCKVADRHKCLHTCDFLLLCAGLVVTVDMCNWKAHVGAPMRW